MQQKENSGGGSKNAKGNNQNTGANPGSVAEKKDAEQAEVNKVFTDKAIITDEVTTMMNSND